VPIANLGGTPLLGELHVTVTALAPSGQLTQQDFAPDAFGELRPGASRVVEVAWDASRSFGDQHLYARIDVPSFLVDADASNNYARADDYVVVSGLGGWTEPPLP